MPEMTAANPKLHGSFFCVLRFGDASKKRPGRMQNAFFPELSTWYIRLRTESQSAGNCTWQGWSTSEVARLSRQLMQPAFRPELLYERENEKLNDATDAAGTIQNYKSERTLTLQ